MDKPLDAFRTIGEMARELGVKTHILRYWEEQFPMLNPLKRAGGRRHYRPTDVDLLKRIHALLNQKGYTIRGARQLLSGGKAEEVPFVPAENNAADSLSTRADQSMPVTAAPAFPVTELRTIRNRLMTALEAA